jgi:hypothetical protein
MRDVAAAYARIGAAAEHSPQRYWSFHEIGGTFYYGILGRILTSSG